jgi:uncharacterized OsmC-like protein
MKNGFPAPNKELAKTKNNHLTGKAPYKFESDTDAATVQRLVEMSERFCVIYQTLRAPPRILVTHQIVAAA